MASRNIKGITIEIGGDTTDLQKALREPEKEISNLQNELAAINKNLQFQPGNTDLIGQKFEVLSGIVEETTSKLKILEDAQSEVQRQFETGDIGEDQYRAFQRELETTRDKAKELAEQASLIDSEFKRAAISAGQSMQELGSKIESAGKAIAPFSAAATAVGAVGVKTFADFDDALRQVQATIGATEDEFSKLSEAARQAGLETKFSATDAANALNYLALAGYDAEKSIETLPKVLNLASAGNLDLAYAADLVTDSMAALGLGTEELDRFVDELVRTSQRANTDVAQLGEAILTVGGQASLAGLNTNDLNTALGILADNGIKGSEGGTALRNTLKNLYTPTDKAASAIAELGVKTTEANGELRDIQDVLQDLDKALSGLSEGDRINVMNQIFDSRTIASANALLKDSGDRWNELSDEIANASGAADEAAGILESGIGGALRELKSALEGAAISLGEALAPAIKNVAGVLKTLATAFANLPAPVQSVIAVFTLLVAALGPLLIITGSLIKNVGLLLTNLPKIMNAVKGIGVALKALSANPFVLIAAAVIALVAAFVYLWNTSEKFRDFWIGLWNGIKEITTTISDAIVSIFTEKIPNAFSSFTEKLSEIWGSIKDFGSNVAAFFTDTIPNAVKDFLSFFKQAPYEIGLILGEAIGHVIQFATEFASKIKEAVSNALTEIKTFFSNLVIAFQQGFMSAIESAKRFATEFPQKMLAAIKSVSDRIVTFAKEFPKKLKDGLSNSLKAAIEWGKDFASKGAAAAKDFADGVIDKIKGLPKQFLQLGKDVINGFINGIKSMFQKAQKAVSDFFNGIVSGVKKTLGIKSPSKVFAGIGSDSADGWMVGWEDQIKNVQRQLGGAVENLISYSMGSLTGQPNLAAAGAYSTAPTSTVYNTYHQERVNIGQLKDINSLIYKDDMSLIRSRAR